MTCSPSQTANLPPAVSGQGPHLHHAEEVLARFGGLPLDDLFPGIEGRPRSAAAATALMDLYRCTGESEVFDCLVTVATTELMARVRARLRSFGALFDPNEVLQDTLVNIFRYPDRFVASRHNAFAAWSAAIVDNAIRRLLRGRRSGPKLALSPIEILAQQADRRSLQPDRQAAAREETRETATAYGIILACYLSAFQRLSDRERFVLQMVEVERMRYAALGELLGIRPEAVKMVVFRARKRVFERIGGLLRLGADLDGHGVAA